MLKHLAKIGRIQNMQKRSRKKTFRWLTLRTTSSCCPTSRQVNWPIAVFILFSGQQQEGLFAAKVN